MIYTAHPKFLLQLQTDFFSKLCLGWLHTVSKEGRCNSLHSTLTHYFGKRAVNTSVQTLARHCMSRVLLICLPPRELCFTSLSQLSPRLSLWGHAREIGGNWYCILIRKNLKRPPLFLPVLSVNFAQGVFTEDQNISYDIGGHQFCILLANWYT